MRYAILWICDNEDQWQVYFNQALQDMYYSGYAIAMKDYVRRGNSWMIHVVFETKADKATIERSFNSLRQHCRVGFNEPRMELCFQDDKLWKPNWTRITLQ